MSSQELAKRAPAPKADLKSDNFDFGVNLHKQKDGSTQSDTLEQLPKTTSMFPPDKPFKSTAVTSKLPGYVSKLRALSISGRQEHKNFDRRVSIVSPCDVRIDHEPKRSDAVWSITHTHLSSGGNTHNAITSLVMCTGAMSRRLS